MYSGLKELDQCPNFYWSEGPFWHIRPAVNAHIMLKTFVAHLVGSASGSVAMPMDKQTIILGWLPRMMPHMKHNALNIENSPI